MLVVALVQDLWLSLRAPFLENSLCLVKGLPISPPAFVSGLDSFHLLINLAETLLNSQGHPQALLQCQPLCYLDPKPPLGSKCQAGPSPSVLGPGDNSVPAPREQLKPEGWLPSRRLSCPCSGTATCHRAPTVPLRAETSPKGEHTAGTELSSSRGTAGSSTRLPCPPEHPVATPFSAQPSPLPRGT